MRTTRRDICGGTCDSAQRVTFMGDRGILTQVQIAQLAGHTDAAIHARYKDVAQVQVAFCTLKAVHLEVRPVYVRREESTCGHMLVAMLSLRAGQAPQTYW